MDGINDNVRVLDNNLLDFSADFSVTSWIYLRNQNSVGIVHKGNSTIKGAALAYGWNSSGFMFLSWNGSNTPYDLQKPADINQWHHLAGVVKGGIRYLYVDGTFVNSSSASVSTWDNINDLYIGSSGNPSSYVNAILDDAKIYNYALTPSQVMQAMHER